MSVNGGTPRRIKKGLAVFFGMAEGDDISLCEKLAYKTANLRIFADGDGKMNLSAAELGLQILVVPNFTLNADTKKGHRPSFIAAAKPETAKPAFELFVQRLKEQGLAGVVQGEFGADMEVEIINDGPITIVMDTVEWK